jgi:hypothetical protein
MALEHNTKRRFLPGMSRKGILSKAGINVIGMRRENYSTPGRIVALLNRKI